MKRFIAVSALAILALIVYAAAPAVKSTVTNENTVTKVMAKSDMGSSDLSMVPDGDKKKKKGEKESCCSSTSNTTAAPAKSCCTSTQSGSAAPAKTCCHSGSQCSGEQKESAPKK